MDFKVFIPTAGKGTRLLGLSRHVNKALVDVNGRPSISYVIEKFDINTRFVIALGYKGNDVRDFLRIAYPERQFEFVTVDPYEGPESGLGYTLLECKEKLQLPFIFCSNDTIVKNEIILPDHNWAGYSDKFGTEEYRSLRVKDDHVTDICPKGAEGNVYPYIGLCGIYDYKEFWSSMESGVNFGSIATGESFGIKDLIVKGLKAYSFNWFDTGNINSLKDARNNIPQALPDANILAKEDESIWFCNNKVIKFHIDEEFIKNRVKRAKQLNPFVPKILDSGQHIYAYSLIEGELMSRNPTTIKFKSFLEQMFQFWGLGKRQEYDKENLKSLCIDFYKDKTYKRVTDFLELYEVHDGGGEINDIYVEEIFDLLESLDWELITEGFPCRFHGDLHLVNILVTEPTQNKFEFPLLDWRQDFGGDLEVGDLYYDLAKLNHGFIISHEIIKNNQFQYIKDQNGNVAFDFHRKESLFGCQEYLKTWTLENGFSWKKVELLTSLIFLNIASLHHYPYSNLLYYLGKYNLKKSIDLYEV